MTEISFFGRKGSLCGFLAKGHSSVDENDTEGKTVCAAVSSAVYLTANSLTDVFGRKCRISVNDARFELHLVEADEVASKIIEGLYIHIKQLKEQYPERIRINTEVQIKC